jgi:hypothetical protein
MQGGPQHIMRQAPGPVEAPGCDDGRHKSTHALLQLGCSWGKCSSKDKTSQGLIRMHSIVYSTATQMHSIVYLTTTLLQHHQQEKRPHKPTSPLPTRPE